MTAEIPELVVCPDHMQIFMFSAVTWNRHHIHYNKDAALHEGLPDIVVQRGLIGNFLARLVTDWIGGRAELRKLTWRVTRSALPQRAIICRGNVTQKIDRADGKYVVCDVTASTDSGELIAFGSATLEFTPEQRED